MPDDVWHDVEFVLGLKAKNNVKGEINRVDFAGAWARGPSGNLDAETRLIEVRLQVPESHWKLPAIRGKLRSELTEEYEAFLESLS